MKEKSTLDAVLQAALDKRVATNEEIVALEALKADSATRLTTLELSCDLSDAGALGEIGRLQVVSALLPRRMSARNEALVESDQAIIDAANKFISNALIPRLNELLTRARSATRAALEPHFAQAKELAIAVDSSGVVSELASIKNNISITTNPPFGAVRYGSQLLEAWRQAAAIEAKLS